MQSLTMLCMYLLGIVVALGMAWIFKKTLLKGETPMLIMELPPYRRPVLKVVVRHMWDRSKLFLQRAGTVILGINILLWFLVSYPRHPEVEKNYAARRAALLATASPKTRRWTEARRPIARSIGCRRGRRLGAAQLRRPRGPDAGAGHRAARF
jgi:Fe2+ transport system protein B